MGRRGSGGCPAGFDQGSPQSYFHLCIDVAQVVPRLPGERVRKPDSTGANLRVAPVPTADSLARTLIGVGLPELTTGVARWSPPRTTNRLEARPPPSNAAPSCRQSSGWLRFTVSKVQLPVGLLGTIVVIVGRLDWHPLCWPSRSSINRWS